MARSGFLVVLAVVALATLTVAWLWRDDPALVPLFASPSALWSTIGIFVGSLFIACSFFFMGHRKARRERRTLGFVEKRIQNFYHSPEILYRPREPDFAATGLLADNAPEANERLMTSTGRILSMLHNDARFFRYEPVHLVMRAEEPNLRQFSLRISAVQTLAIRAGILGTFVGLIMSLGQVQEVFLLRGTEIGNSSQAASLAADFNDIKTRMGHLMGEVVQGLALAFGTSIAGILAAILIALLASFARGREDRLIREIQSVAIAAQRLFRDTTSSNGEFARTAEELQDALKANLSTLSETRADVHRHAERLATVSGQLAEGLSDPVRLFAENSAGIKSMLEQGRDAAENVRQMIERMRAIETLSAQRLEQLSTDIDRAATSSRDAVSAALEHNRQAVDAALEKATAVLSAGLSNTGTLVVAGLGNSIEEGFRRGLAEGLAAHLSGPGSPVQDLLERVSSDSRRQQHRAFVLYVAAIIGLTLANITSAHWDGISRMYSAAWLPSSSAGVEGATDAR